ncbi:MAG: maleate cis-trans isomerase family protein [Candidatus Dormibacterales bacterium]
MTRTDALRRVGVIVPSSNTVVEPDFQSLRPADVTVHSARMHLVETTVAGERAMLEKHLPQAVEDIASMRPHVVAFACTSAGALIGQEAEQDLIARMADSCGCPVVSTNDAAGRLVERSRARRVAILTPYLDELNVGIGASIERRGVEVVALAGMGLSENFKIASVPPEEIVEYALARLTGLAFDLLFVSCTNFRALAARPALAERLGVPVVTSNQATIEVTLETLGVGAPAPRAAALPS